MYEATIKTLALVYQLFLLLFSCPRNRQRNEDSIHSSYRTRKLFTVQTVCPGGTRLITSGVVAAGAAMGAAAGMSMTPNSSSSSTAWRRWARSALLPFMSRLLLASSAFSSETLRSARGIESVREKQNMVMVLCYLEIELMPGTGGGVTISRRWVFGGPWVVPATSNERNPPSAKYTQENENKTNPTRSESRKPARPTHEVTTDDDEVLAPHKLATRSVHVQVVGPANKRWPSHIAHLAENSSPKNVFQTCGILAGPTFSFDTLISLILNENIHSPTLPQGSARFLAL